MLARTTNILADAQAAIQDAVSGNLNVTVHSYPRCGHAFARYTGTRCDAAAAFAGKRPHQPVSEGQFGLRDAHVRADVAGKVTFARLSGNRIALPASLADDVGRESRSTGANLNETVHGP